jgi:hypothetical protein
VVVALAREAAFQQCDIQLEKSLWSLRLGKDIRSTDWKSILDQHLTWDNNRLHSLVPPHTPSSFRGQAWLVVRASSLQDAFHQRPHDLLFLYHWRWPFIIGNHEIHGHSNVGGCLLLLSCTKFNRELRVKFPADQAQSGNLSVQLRRNARDYHAVDP